jgi:NHL repeat.
LSGGDPLNPHNLFHFGDRSGLVSGALYQHPLDVLFVPQERSVFVADTYNHRIKVILLDEGRVEVFAGTGKPGWNDGAADAAQFWEPSGLTLAKDGRFLWVADTNNHAIRQIDLKTRETSTWMR